MKQKQITDIMNEDAKDELHKQKTAMQIMLDELLSHGYKIPFHLVVKCKDLLEMDKQQKMDAYNQGYRDGEIDASNPTNISKDISEFSNAENYVNQTYGGKK
jgi:hypothetical protein